MLVALKGTCDLNLRFYSIPDSAGEDCILKVNCYYYQ